MTDPVVCSHCGARNPAEAEWCGQCFAPLSDRIEDREIPPPAGETAEPARAVREDVVAMATPVGTADGAQPEGPVAPAKGTWVCSVCEVTNALETEQCSACGTSIFTSFGAAVEEQVRVDPQQALLRSVVFPGLGHAYAKQGLLGSAIGGLAIMSIGFGIGLVVTGVGDLGWPILLQAAGVWVAAAFDAYRIAGGQETSALLLKPRVITALVGGVMITVILAAFLRGSV